MSKGRLQVHLYVCMYQFHSFSMQFMMGSEWEFCLKVREPHELSRHPNTSQWKAICLEIHENLFMYCKSPSIFNGAVPSRTLDSSHRVWNQMTEPEGKRVSLLLRKPTTNGTPLPEHALVLMTYRLARRCKVRAPAYRGAGAAVIRISDRRQPLPK